ncbi:zinc-binding dehydrogenase [Amycolatopsis sp. 195334CR]|nr:zinc-binding dehydrogenase [Amycolatopsis sp. 195334CR]
MVKERFVCRIPEGIGLDEAAPLLCAGITTYSPLHQWGAGPGKKVAAAMGAEVTVLSQSLKKQEDGLKQLGATHYHATSDDSTFEDLAGSFDVILNTVSAKIPVDAYLGLLKVGGALVNVGAPAEPLSYQQFSLIMGNKSIAGPKIGGIAETQQMLDFCAKHHIGAEIEVIGAEDVESVYERVTNSEVRYRFVIDTATIGA